MKAGTYQHYKGNLYEVIATATHSETLEPMVVYKALYDTPDFGYGAIWVRPQSMFEEIVNYQGNSVPRFKLVSE